MAATVLAAVIHAEGLLDKHRCRRQCRQVALLLLSRWQYWHAVDFLPWLRVLWGSSLRVVLHNQRFGDRVRKLIEFDRRRSVLLHLHLHLGLLQRVSLLLRSKHSRHCWFLLLMLQMVLVN